MILLLVKKKDSTQAVTFTEQHCAVRGDLMFIRRCYGDIYVCMCVCVMLLTGYIYIMYSAWIFYRLYRLYIVHEYSTGYV